MKKLWLLALAFTFSTSLTLQCPMACVKSSGSLSRGGEFCRQRQTHSQKKDSTSSAVGTRSPSMPLVWITRRSRWARTACSGTTWPVSLEPRDGDRSHRDVRHG